MFPFIALCVLRAKMGRMTLYLCKEWARKRATNTNADILMVHSLMQPDANKRPYFIIYRKWHAICHRIEFSQYSTLHWALPTWYCNSLWSHRCHRYILININFRCVFASMYICFIFTAFMPFRACCKVNGFEWNQTNWNHIFVFAVCQMLSFWRWLCICGFVNHKRTIANTTEWIFCAILKNFECLPCKYLKSTGKKRANWIHRGKMLNYKAGKCTAFTFFR